MYTGHAFRRSAATLLADCGADVRILIESLNTNELESDNKAEMRNILLPVIISP